jgi:hypothetical protein
MATSPCQRRERRKLAAGACGRRGIASGLCSRSPSRRSPRSSAERRPPHASSPAGGRRRVQGAAPNPDTDLRHQREIVDAFLAASREGDFDALLAVLDPDVVFRADAGRISALVAVFATALTIISVRVFNRSAVS